MRLSRDQIDLKLATGQGKSFAKPRSARSRFQGRGPRRRRQASRAAGSIIKLGQTKEAVMARLVVHLQDGFAGDTVVVRVNNREVFHKAGVRTKLPLGYADVFETQVPDGSATVEIG